MKLEIKSVAFPPKWNEINMNGCVYDPLVGRFISPDPFVQMPDYSQSYNRYSYAFNNPLRFSDPSGFFAEGDSTIMPTAELPFLPAKNKPSYRPKASTNTDNTSLGSGVKETETTLPIPYQQSKLSNDAEGNAEGVAGQGFDVISSADFPDIPREGYSWKEGNPTMYYIDKTTLVVSKSTGKYINLMSNQLKNEFDALHRKQVKGPYWSPVANEGIAVGLFSAFGSACNPIVGFGSSWRDFGWLSILRPDRVYVGMIDASESAVDNYLNRLQQRRLEYYSKYGLIY